jgi:predicted nucleic acid-binding protein
MTKLLDTTFLIDYWAGTENVREYLERNDDTEFCTTALNIKEIAVGRRLQGAFEWPDLKATFEWVETVPFTADHARVASNFEAELYDSETYTRRQIDDLSADLLIAAVAAERDATVVTNNGDDFESFGVEVEAY